MSSCCASCIFGTAVGAICAKNFYITVNPDEIAALEFMGSFKKILMPGIHNIYPGCNVRRLSTRLRQNEVTVETKTKDNVFVRVKIAVQQEVSVDSAYQAFYKLTRPDAQIDSFVADVVRSHVPREDLDESFLSKESLALEVKERLTVGMLEYGYKIHEVLVTDIMPDVNVKNSMNQIEAQKRLRMAAQERAEQDKMILVKAAEAESESKALYGMGVAASRQAIVSGLTEAIYGEGTGEKMDPKQVSEMMMVTQYLDTMIALSGNASNSIIMPHNMSKEELHHVASSK